MIDTLTVFRIIFVTLLSHFISVLLISIWEYSIHSTFTIIDFVYVLIVGGFNVIIQYIIFLYFLEVINRKFIKKKSLLGFLIELGIGMFLAGVVILMFAVFDYYSSPKAMVGKALDYILGYTTFITFVPVAISINYIIKSHGYTKKPNSE